MAVFDPTTQARIEAALAADEGPASRAARARIAAGTYGLCLRCGAEVTADVLVTRPTWALCADCSEALEDVQRSRRHGICGNHPD